MALFEQEGQVDTLPAKEGDEYNRTHTKLEVSQGDVPAVRLFPDPRLPKLFKYQFGGQSGYVTIPKGRIVSVAPDYEYKSFKDDQYYNVLTLANGGEDVTEANFDPELDEPGSEDYTRVANKPVGVAGMNVYQNHKDSFKGNIPNFMTRQVINVPYFGSQTEAEKFDWGAIYGSDIKPGDKVKSDKNGRFVKWKEFTERMDVFDGDGTQTTFNVKAAIHPDVEPADIEVTDTTDDSTISVSSIVHTTGEVELASAPATGTDNVEITYKSILGDSVEQKVGEVLSIDNELLPTSWLKWVQPEGAADSNGGEDGAETGFETQHLDEDGYPYDEQYMDGYGSDNYRPTGIPGLTDGSALEREFTDELLGEVQAGVSAGEKYNFHVMREPIVESSTPTIKFKDTSDGTVTEKTFDNVVDFIDREEGLIIIKVDQEYANDQQVLIDYQATGQMPGVPSNLNWEGVVGSADILLQL